TMAGPGGAIGHVLFATVLAAGQGVLGPLGTVFVWTFGLALATTLVLLALGLTLEQWRLAGRIVAKFIKGAITYGRWVAGLLARFVGPVRRSRPVPGRAAAANA